MHFNLYFCLVLCLGLHTCFYFCFAIGSGYGDLLEKQMSDSIKKDTYLRVYTCLFMSRLQDIKISFYVYRR